MVEESKAEEKDTVNFYPSDKNKIKINETSCKVKTGCNFQVEALEDVKGKVYIGDNDEGVSEAEILLFDSSNKFTKKVREGQQVYIKKTFTEKTQQVIVNTGNVLVYAASTAKCTLPSESCH